KGTDLPIGQILVQNGWLTQDTFSKLLAEQRPSSVEAFDHPRYQLQGKLGEGATSVVYRAWDRDVKRHVAIKILRESAAMSDVARERFHREAQAAGGLSHPNVVVVYDVGEAGGRLFIALELVLGRSLGEAMREGKAREELLRSLVQASLGVAAAHARNIVHRDLKPQNIMVTPAGEAKVGDFGLAHLGTATLVLTRAGSTLGTPLYMAPEQVKGDSKAITPRTDVYALGAILYEILAGNPPHTGETVFELYHKILTEDPRVPDRRARDVAGDLLTVALKALEKDPSRRYPTAHEFTEDLRRALEAEPIQARPEGNVRRLWRRASRNRRFLIPLALAALVGMGIAVLPQNRRREAAAQAIRKARDFGQAHPTDVDGLVPLWQEAVFASDGTPYLADSKREHEAAKVRQRDLGVKELADLDQRISAFLGKEEYKSAQDALEGARPRHAAPEWALEISQRASTMAEAAGKALAKVKEQAATAKRDGDEATASELRGRVARWGLPKSISEFDQALAAVSLPKPLSDPALVGYWPLDEGSGQAAADASGKGHTATLAGTEWVPGKFGSGLRFDGAQSMMELPSSADLDRLQEGDYTLAAWFKPEAIPAAGQEPYAVIVKAGRHTGLVFDAEGRFYMGHWVAENGGTYLHNATFRGFDANVFHHVAAVVDWTHGATRVYVDGALEKTGEWPRPKPAAFGYGNTPWRVGCATSGASQYRFPAKAVIDEVRLYARALSDAEVQVLYRARLAGK
ncbi:MAG TPA: protein kinase, partial [Planctomycetota bacterium]|nr:protein kinase [Planctomycetota bacterium]